MLQEGQKAPKFILVSNNSGEVSLESYLGKRVILYFYPKDSTPGCTLEARDFQSLQERFANINTYILGVSKDSVASHEQFASKECLSFPLLADVSGVACEAYGVLGEKSMYGKKYFGINRSTFLIDEKGEIVKIWQNVSAKGHAAEVLKFTSAL
jgi:thioredoxin-dependent peroxiredoxin